MLKKPILKPLLTVYTSCKNVSFWVYPPPPILEKKNCILIFFAPSLSVLVWVGLFVTIIKTFFCWFKLKMAKFIFFLNVMRLILFQLFNTQTPVPYSESLITLGRDNVSEPVIIQGSVYMSTNVVSKPQMETFDSFHKN